MTGHAASTGFNIRALEAQDLDGMLAVAASSVEAPQWPRRSYEQILMEQIFVEQTPVTDPTSAFTRFALGAFSAGALAGFAIANLLRAEGLAELETIAVSPGFRRRSAGARLLASLMDLAGRWGSRTMRLEVRESNEAALALYRSLGFRPAGRRPSYYPAPVEDALILECNLGAPRGAP